MKYFRSCIIFASTFFFLTLLFSSPSSAQLRNHDPPVNFPGATYSPSPLLSRYNVHYMKLDLQISDSTVAIQGSVIINAAITESTDTLVFDFAKNMVADSILLNGNSVSFSHTKDIIVVALAESLNAGENFSALIYYHGNPSDGLYLNKNQETGITVVASVSESYLLKNWVPCKQILSDKIDSLDIWITTSKTNQAGANGLLKQVVDVDEDHHQFKWHSSYKIAYYLISVAVGNYAIVTDHAHPPALHGDSILIQNFVYNDSGFISDHENNIKKIAPFVELFSNLYGLYPWWKEKYGVALAAIGNTSGMENQTLSTCVSFEATLNAHELGHQWFGDHVTCKTFNDIWLNEGFAVYSEYLALEYRPDLFPAYTLPGYVYAWHASVMSKDGGSVYVPQKDTYDENRIFNGRLTYNKGGSLVHMLRFEIGNDSLFFAVLREYQSAFADSVAVANDFKNIAQQVTGINFDAFFNEWYYGQGFPSYTIHYSRNGNILTLNIRQKTSKPSKMSFFKMKMEYLLKSPEGDTTIFLYQTQPSQNFQITTLKTITGIIVDPNDWVIDGPATVIQEKESIASFAKCFVEPNPSGDEVCIEASKNFNRVSLVTVNGSIALQNTFREPGTYQCLSVKAISSGIYTVTLMNGNEIIGIVKMIKQ